MAEATLSERLVVEIAADTTPLADGLGRAGRDLSQFAGGTVGQATRGIQTAFDGTFRGMERAIARAARTGAFSVRDMVDSIVSDLARIAVRESIVEPVAGAIRDIIGSVIGGTPGRAAGGPVAPGNAYLVGERGPELFIPAGGGEIVPNVARPRPQIVVNVQARDAESFLKSESQIAAMVWRAVTRGQRNL